MNKKLGLNFYLSYFLKGWKEILFNNGPIFVTFFVTARCNARCDHCLYWDRINKIKNELTLEEIGKIAKHMPPFPKLLLSGGEPFLRTDIDEICKMFYLDSKVKQITIPTNGILSDDIYKKVKNILKYCPAANIQAQISIDGLGEAHDKIRKVPHAFDNMMETYRMLKDLEEKYKNFEIDFCFTFSLLNQNYVEDTYKYLRQHGINNFHLILARNPVKNKHLLEFDIEKYSLYNKALLRDIFSTKMGLSERIFNIRRRHQAGIIRNVVSDNRFKFKCTAGTLAVVIDELGLVYPCETKKTIFGSLREQDYDFSTIWHSDVAHSFRKTVMSEGCRCTHETNTITNISFSPRFYFKFLTDYLKVNFYGR